MRWRRALPWFGVLLLGLSPGLGWGASLHGRTSTVLQWWERADDGRDVSPLTQYLSFAARDLVAGQDLAVRGYGRLTKDLSGGDPWMGKVFYLYADWNDAWKDHLDLRAGRQFAQNAAGSAVVDGAEFTLRGFGPVALRAFGGGDVQHEDPYQGGDAVAGASLLLDGLRGTFIEAGVFAAYDEWDLSRLILGLSASQDLWTWGRTYGDLQYDYLGYAVNEVLLGLRVWPVPGWAFAAEYFESLPVFDSTGIYSVFATEKFQEGRLRATWDVQRHLRLFGGVSRYWFEDGDRATDVEVGARVFDLYDGRVELAVNRRVGYGGDLTGFRVELGRDFLNRKLAAELGAEYQLFRRHEDPDDDDTGSYWGELGYRYTAKVTTTARLENVVDGGGRNHVEGLLRVDWDF